MYTFANWDLVILAVIVAGIGFIGVSVFFSNRKSISNLSFLLFAIVTMVWSTANFVYAKGLLPDAGLMLVRTIIFLGVWHSFTFFQLCYVFPAPSIHFKKWYRFGLFPLALLVSILTLTPLTLQPANPANGTGIGNGPGIAVFGLFVTVLIIAGITLLLKKSIRFRGIERQQTAIVTLGTFLTFLLIFIFNVIFPAALNIPSFIPYSALFIFPFLVFTAYSILKLHLFDVKAVAIGSLMFLLAVANVIGALFADSPSKVLINAAEFLMTLLFGFFLIRGVIREVKQREEIERLAGDLKKANERLKVLDKMKSEFVSIASHQLRSPLTSIRGYASMLTEGSYGKLPAKAAEAIQRIGDSSRYMALSIEDYLNVSRIEAGNMKYEKADFNLKEVAEKIVDEMRPVALKKGLLMVFRSDCDGSCRVNADIGKVRQVIMNLIDNAMKYTPKGSIDVVAHDDVKKKKMYVTIKDTGVGMSKETLDEVFHKFIRAKNANEINVTGTGLGLFVAKKMIEEMGGRITAESEGEGKGSKFNVEFPLLPGRFK